MLQGAQSVTTSMQTLRIMKTLRMIDNVVADDPYLFEAGVQSGLPEKASPKIMVDNGDHLQFQVEKATPEVMVDSGDHL